MRPISILLSLGSSTPAIRAILHIVLSIVLTRLCANRGLVPAGGILRSGFLFAVAAESDVDHREDAEQDEHHGLSRPLEHREGSALGLGDAVEGEAEHDGDVPGAESAV